MSRNYLTIWQAYEKSQANTTASTKCSLARVNIFSKYSHTKISQYGRFVKHYCNCQQDYYQRWKIKTTWRFLPEPARRTWQNRLADRQNMLREDLTKISKISIRHQINSPPHSQLPLLVGNICRGAMWVVYFFVTFSPFEWGWGHYTFGLKMLVKYPWHS